MKPFATALITSFLVTVITSILIFTGVINLKKILPEDFISSEPLETSTEVPNFVNLKLTEAEKVAQQFGLKIIPEEKFLENTQPDVILSQFPLPGFVAKKGDSVKLSVAKAVEITIETMSEEDLMAEIELTDKVIMPDINGLNFSTAKDLLGKSGITNISENFEDNEMVEKDKIISFNPPAGSEISSGAVVDIVVSKGAAIKQVIVPNLYNKSLETAKSEIQRSRLKLGKVNKVTDEDKAFDRIIGQSIQWGQKVKEGTVIDINLNAEAEEKLGW
jgi:eukaryotic-like serine/threonine-protein kinase